MALSRRLVSQAFPYLPITLTVQGHTATLLALLDTGFDGDIVVPRGFFPPNVTPDHTTRWALADGSRVLAPSFVGTAQIGQFSPFKVTAIALGTKALIGLAAIGSVTIISIMVSVLSSNNSSCPPRLEAHGATGFAGVDCVALQAVNLSEFRVEIENLVRHDTLVH